MSVELKLSSENETNRNKELYCSLQTVHNTLKFLL